MAKLAKKRKPRIDNGTIPGYDPKRDGEGFRFDRDRADLACDFFSECLTHVKGDKAGKKFVLEPWQRAIIRAMFGWVDSNGLRRYRTVFIYVPRKNGKMLDLQTPIPTPAGWTDMGDIKVGDRVFDVDGTTCSVTGLSEIDKTPESYLMKFSNFEAIKACADHQWITSAMTERPDGKLSEDIHLPVPKTRTTKEIYETLTYGYEECANHVISREPRNVTIESVEPCASVPMRCIEVDSPTHQYLCGATGIPTHNSTMCAGIATYLLFCDNEKGAEIYSAAAEAKQSAIVFNMAKEMVKNEPELMARCEIFNRSITVEDSNSFYMPLSAESYSKHGFNLHAAIIDELHAHPNGDLMDVLETSTGSRSQPLICIITTADWSRPESPCNEKLLYAQQVRDGDRHDPRFLPVIYETMDSEDWTDRKVWRKSNPCMGISLREDIIENDFRQAEGNPRKESVFKRLHLNMMTKIETRWLLPEKWDSCQVPEFDIPDGSICYAGLDLASTIDISALVLFFPELDGLLYPFFWVPEDHPENHRRASGGLYRPWIEAGHMLTTPGEVTDYKYIRSEVNRLFERFPFELAVDPYNARHLAIEIREDDGIPVVEFRQGYITMNEPTKEFERRIIQKTISHFGNPVMRWMIGNAVVKTDPAGNIKVDKEKSTDKVDGVVASIMALGRSMNYEKPDSSAYENRGIVYV